jgi:hypothetical protein
MEIVDNAVVRGISELMRDLKKCELVQQDVIQCGWLDRILECGVPFFCGRRLFESINQNMLEVCGAGFYRACPEFGDVIAPLCPFGPVPFEHFEQFNVRLDALEAKVGRLLAR